VNHYSESHTSHCPIVVNFTRCLVSWKDSVLRTLRLDRVTATNYSHINEKSGYFIKITIFCFHQATCGIEGLFSREVALDPIAAEDSGTTPLNSGC
jgi:hypothetical protein